MKIFAFALLIAGVTALPQNQVDINTYNDGGLITGQIISAIRDVSDSIRDAGLDPLEIKREVGSYQLPVPVIFNAAVFVEDILSHGLSNIVIHDVSYSVLFSRLTLNIELPHIHVSIGRAMPQVTVFGNTLTVETSGRADVRSISFRCVINVRVGIITGISITNVNTDFRLGGVDSNLNLRIQGTDYSNQLNAFIGGIIPDTINEFKAELDELFNIVLLQVINDNL